MSPAHLFLYYKYAFYLGFMPALLYVVHLLVLSQYNAQQWWKIFATNKENDYHVQLQHRPTATTSIAEGLKNVNFDINEIK
jgi:hypothetical protein